MGIRRNDHEVLQDIGYRTFSDDSFRVYRKKNGNEKSFIVAEINIIGWQIYKK